MSDMRTPDGWTVGAAQGDIYGTDKVEFVLLAGGNALVPKRFSLLITQIDGDTDQVAALQFEVRDGYPVFIEMYSSEELSGVLHSITRVHSLEWWKRKAVYELTYEIAENDTNILSIVRSQHPEADPDFLEGVERRLVTMRESAWQQPMRPARRRVTEERLVDVANRYKEAVAAGSRTPTKDVADQLNEGKERNEVLSHSRVAHLVSAARKRGLLPATQRGRPNA